MTNVINVHDFKTHYSKYLDQVVQGDEIVLGKHGKAVAKLVPLTLPKTPRKPGGLRGKIWFSDDFNEPMMALWENINNKGNKHDYPA